MSKVPDRIDMVKYAQGLLPFQFRGKAKWNKLLSVFAKPFQRIENALFDLLLNRAISTGAGKQLDIIGEILNSKRLGADDARYRLRLKASVLILKSSGTQPQLLAILAQLMAGVYEYFARPPASWVITAQQATPDDEAAELASSLGQAKAAGVNGQFIFSNVADDETFTFSDDDTQQTSALQGFPSDDSGFVIDAFAEASFSGFPSGQFSFVEGDGAGRWLATGSGKWFYSTDNGATFSSLSAPAIDSVAAIKFFAGNWWIVGTNSGAPTVLRASALATGSVSFDAAMAPGESPTAIAYSGSAFVIAGTAHFFRTTDPMAVAWTMGSAGAAMFGSGAQDRLRYEGGRFIGADLSTLYVSADDGVTFSAISSGTIGTNPGGFASTSARIAVMGASGAIRTSDNGGSTWTARTSGSSNTFKSGGIVNGVFVAGTNAGEVCVSADGATWVKTLLDGALSFGGIKSAGDVVALVDVDDLSATAWVSADDGASWSARSAAWTGPGFSVVCLAVSSAHVAIGGSDNAGAPTLAFLNALDPTGGKLADALEATS